MSTTQQPQWTYLGRIGDADPIAYGGGFIYTDSTGHYPPEMTWFEEATTDKDWKDNGERAEVTEYRIVLEEGTTVADDRRPHHEWWWEDLNDVAEDSGIPLEELEDWADSDLPMERAQLYQELISYHGAFEFDPYPVKLTEKQAYAKYAEEIKRAQS